MSIAPLTEGDLVFADSESTISVSIIMISAAIPTELAPLPSLTLLLRPLGHLYKFTVFGPGGPRINSHDISLSADMFDAKKSS